MPVERISPRRSMERGRRQLRCQLSSWIGPALLLLLLTGCAGGPRVLSVEQQVLIDRRVVEYPANTELRPYIEGLSAATAMCFDTDGTLLVAEGGYNARTPRIIAFKADGSMQTIYPRGRRLPFGLGRDPLDMRGPIGGMVADRGRIFITHRDPEDRGVVTAINADGTFRTLVGGLPARGDHSVTDIAINPLNGRLFFGVGTATNSSVVGIDNQRWLKQYRTFHDRPSMPTYLLGRRFDTPNPFAGIFGGSDIAVTAPFQAFGSSNETYIRAASDNKPTGAIYSVDPNGGDLRVEAHGIRNPVGMRFSELNSLFFTNQGMKLRGTRPVQDDPDVMLRWVQSQWYGWPDFSANLLPIYDQRFQPKKPELIIRSGYRDLSFLIDHERSSLQAPSPNSNLLAAEFKPLSGAAKFDFAPAAGPFSRLRQGGLVAVVALWGDRAPYDNSGQKLIGPQGYRVVQVNIDDRAVKDFVRNTREWPKSKIDAKHALERPIDVKFGPDGGMYILDFGRMKMRGAGEEAIGGTGRIFKLTAAK